MATQREGGIAWTDLTWNPVTGCTKVSAGCANCYAERYAGREIGDFRPVRRVVNDIDVVEHRDFTEVRCHPDRLDQPRHWRKGRNVFVCSMGDLFHEAVPDAFIDHVFAVMVLSRQHTFQILTKRPERMNRYFADVCAHLGSTIVFKLDRDRFAVIAKEDWPLSNCWGGVSVEDQATADERIPLLLKTPAAVRGVSIEPMLGPVSLRWLAAWNGSALKPRPSPTDHMDGLRCIDWVIVGGESGPKARPMHPDWVRSIRDQCQTAGVPFFFKGWGEWMPDDQCRGDDFVIKPGHPGAPKEFIDKPVCHLSPGLHAFRVGKRTAGRLLDGREWSEFPKGGGNRGA